MVKAYSSHYILTQKYAVYHRVVDSLLNSIRRGCILKRQAFKLWRSSIPTGDSVPLRGILVAWKRTVIYAQGYNKSRAASFLMQRSKSAQCDALFIFFFNLGIVTGHCKNTSLTQVLLFRLFNSALCSRVMYSYMCQKSVL